MDADRVSPDMQELLPDYLEDARECLEQVSQLLLGVEARQGDPDVVPELFRQMHIIKGGAGLMGFSTLERVAHAAEDILGAVKRGERPFDPAVAAALLEGHDAVRALLDELEAAGETATDPTSVVERLRSVDGAPAPEPPPAQDPTPAATAHPEPEAAAEPADDSGAETDEVLREFFLESWELIDELDEDLVALEESGGDPELLNKIFRAAHTLKGSSSFLGFQSISQVTHRVEDIFNKLRRNETSMTPELMDVILEAVDRVRNLPEAAQSGSVTSFCGAAVRDSGLPNMPPPPAD